MKLAEERKSLWSLVLWATVAVIVVCIVLLAVLKKPKEKVEEVGEKAVPVKVMTAEPRALPDTIRIPGRLAPFVEAQLAAEKPGRVVELAADKGDRVEAGQVLLRLDSRAWEEVLKRAETEHREATRDLERWQGLVKEGAVAASDFDSIRTRAEMAAIALSEAQVHLSQCEVRSPVDGLVDDRHVEVGEYATEGMPVLKVINIDPIKLVFDVPERDILALALGDALPFSVSVFTDRVFTGKVAFVSSLATRESNSFRAELLTDNPGHDLKPGMIAEVFFTRRIREAALAVPLAAVIPKKGEHVVFIEQDSRAVRRIVKIDAIHGSEAILGEGIDAGDRVIIEGHRALVDGALVESVDGKARSTNSEARDKPE